MRVPLGGGMRIIRGSVCTRPASAGSSSEIGVNGEPGSKSDEVEDVEVVAEAGVLDGTERFVLGYG